MATTATANWVASLSYSSLPPQTVQSAIRSFYNWTGCTVGGSAHPATTIAHNALAPFFGSPTSTLLGKSEDTRKKTIDAQHAALINGIASHVHDYDDTHLETVIHPTGPVAAAVLAIAETQQAPVSGEELITALVAGIEVQCKCGLAVWPSHYDVGWHITSTTGSIGAAVAVSKLLHLTEDQTAHAIGIAATQVTGLREMFGSHTKSFHPGRAAQNGLMAAILASNGYTSSLEALEAKRGWANVVGDEDTSKLDAQIATLGKTGCWEIEKNAFKPFPCGIVIHPVIDGCIQLHEQTRGTEGIQNVQLTVHPLVLELTGKAKPRDGLEAKFSIYHGAAVGLLLGRATPAQYEDAVVLDSDIVKLREKVHATADANTRPDECHIAINVFSGTSSIEKTVHHAVGSVDSPMSDNQLTDKFMDQCVPILGAEKAKRASEWCWSLNRHDDIHEIKDIF